jgi:hypothetical protein
MVSLSELAGISSYLFFLSFFISSSRFSNENILIDQFLVIHALAWLVVDEPDLFHLFLVLNGLEKFVADRADLDHNL